MMPHVAAPNRNGKGQPLLASRIAASERLGRLAASPWALACGSFLATAILIRSDSLTFF